MKKDTKDVEVSPAGLGMTLEDLLREGARDLIEQAVAVELSELLAGYESVRTLEGQQAVVRNSYLPKRALVTPIGPVSVRIPKVRECSGGKVKFNSALVPPYVRRSKSLSAALPWLYLKGISTGEMQSALEVLGEEAKGLSPAVVSRLKAHWSEEYGAWMKRDLSQERYVYWWVDGIYSSLRSEDERLCLLIIIGVLPTGEKRFVAISVERIYERMSRKARRNWRYEANRLAKEFNSMRVECYEFRRQPVVFAANARDGFSG